MKWFQNLAFRYNCLAEHAVVASRQTAITRGELVSLAQSLHAGLSQFKA